MRLVMNEPLEVGEEKIYALDISFWSFFKFYFCSMLMLYLITLGIFFIIEFMVGIAGY